VIDAHFGQSSCFVAVQFSPASSRSAILPCVKSQLLHEPCPNPWPLFLISTMHAFAGFSATVSFYDPSTAPQRPSHVPNGQRQASKRRKTNPEDHEDSAAA
jgi:hypothetical protein